MSEEKYTMNDFRDRLRKFVLYPESYKEKARELFNIEDDSIVVMGTGMSYVDLIEKIERLARAGKGSEAFKVIDSIKERSTLERIIIKAIVAVIILGAIGSFILFIYLCAFGVSMGWHHGL